MRASREGSFINFGMKLIGINLGADYCADNDYTKAELHFHMICDVVYSTLKALE